MTRVRSGALLKTLAVLLPLVQVLPAAALEVTVGLDEGRASHEPNDSPAGTPMRGASGSRTLVYHHAPSLRIREVALRVRYENSLAVLPDRSSLTVSVNGRDVATLPAEAAMRPIAAEILIPPHLFEAGPNRVTVAAAHTHRLSCTREAAKELWTRLDEEETKLRVELEPTDGPIAPSERDRLVAASAFDDTDFIIASNRTPNDPALLRWGGAIAEGIALRRGARPVSIEFVRADHPTDAALPKGHNIFFVGTSRRSHGPRMVHRGAFFLIDFSARHDEAVTKAVEEFRRSAGALRERRPVLSAGSTIQLSDLGLGTYSARITDLAALEIPITLPPTLYGSEAQRLRLELDLAYQGLSPESAAIVYANGAPWNLVRLDRTKGAILNDLQVDIPLNVFSFGRNTISIQPVLTSREPEDCGAELRKVFSIFSDSRIHVPHFIENQRLIDLGQLRSAAYPLVKNSRLVLGKPSAERLSALWMIRGKLAQMHGRPLTSLETALSVASSGHQLILAEPRGDNDDRIGAAAWSASTHATNSIAARSIEGAAQDERRQWLERLRDAPSTPSSSWLSRAGQWLDGITSAFPENTEELIDDLPPEMTRSGARLSIEGPHIVLRPSAGSPVDDQVEALISVSIWDEMEGTSFYWNDTRAAFVAERVGPELVEVDGLAPDDLPLLARTWLARHPLAFLSIILTGVVLLSFATSRALGRVR